MVMLFFFSVFFFFFFQDTGIKKPDRIVPCCLVTVSGSLSGTTAHWNTLSCGSLHTENISKWKLVT